MHVAACVTTACMCLGVNQRLQNVKPPIENNMHMTRTRHACIVQAVAGMYHMYEC